jgi:hypothetical protein
MTQYTVVDGIAYPIADGPAPVALQAAEAVYVSPLARLSGATGAASVDLPAELLPAWNGAPQGYKQRAVRETARILRLAGFSCTIDETATDTETGETVTLAKHGYWRRAKSGDACKGTDCAGKVR